MLNIARQPGGSRRSRANRKRMQQEYDEQWEERLSGPDKPQVYKKFGLPLVLMPFVLMLCGGCVAAAPWSMAIVALLLGLVWLGDTVIEENETHNYYVVYSATPVWLVGEDVTDAVVRRAKADASTYVQRYPIDYAGRIHSVIPIADRVPTYCDKLTKCVELPLTRSQLHACNHLALKVVDSTLVASLLEDRLGATYDDMISNHTSAELTVAFSATPPETGLTKKIEDEYSTALKSLPRTVTHTGTGLYRVKISPAHNDDAQSGAPVGQVITLTTGGLGASGWEGGYIVNATETETLAIVSHTDGTVTLEGDLTNWTNTDDLDIYDAWSTIAGATSQLFTDQGATEYTSTQVIEIFDGAYTEAVTVTTMAPRIGHYLAFQAATGETSVAWSNNGTAASQLVINNTENIHFYDFEFILIDAAMAISNSSANGFVADNMHWDASGGSGVLRGFWTNQGVIHNCQFTDCTHAIYDPLVSYCYECTFTGCDYGIYASSGPFVVSCRGCVFDTTLYCIRTGNSNWMPGCHENASEMINCTCYNGTYGIYFAGDADERASQFRCWNTIFYTFTDAFHGASSCPKGRVDSDYNTFYDCTNVADLDGVTYNLANWKSWTDQRGNAPDANSVTTDPDITTPGSDWSLASASDCIHAGVGAYAVCVTGINGVDFDKDHPDKGAWSSGVGPNVAY